MDMNGLLSGLASSQSQASGCGHEKRCCNNNNNNNNNGIFGGSSIILIIILLCFCGGFGGQGQNSGTVCGCDPKHVKELCRVGGSSGGCGGFGGGFGGEGGSGIWIIIVILLLFCGGRKQNRGCTNNFINIDNDEDC